MEFPSLRRHPSYNTLIQILHDLEIHPSSWGQPSTLDDSQGAEKEAALRFLMAIIANEFEWFENYTINGTIISIQDQKENLLQLASRRVAERCGRTAMPEVTRTWVIPASAILPEFRFEIREPPLTGDNLGLKTWGTALVIAKKLEYFSKAYLNSVLHKQDEDSVLSDVASRSPRARVLELGSGTGLVGIAAGAIWGANIILTDLPEIEGNLLYNIEKSKNLVTTRGGSISGRILDWRTSDGSPPLPSKSFEVIIAADPLYDDEHPALLANVINKFLDDAAESTALVAIPMRDNATRNLASRFYDLICKTGFKLEASGKDICRDDWESEDSEAVEVEWYLWRREGTLVCEEFCRPHSGISI